MPSAVGRFSIRVDMMPPSSFHEETIIYGRGSTKLYSRHAAGDDTPDGRERHFDAAGGRGADMPGHARC